MNHHQRDTLFIEQAGILSQVQWPGSQFILRVHAPECARHAQPGSFAHLRCHPLQAMRRPLSIMAVDREVGWVEFLYKVVGAGTQLLSEQVAGQHLSILGPIGNGFEMLPTHPNALLLGGGVGIPPMIFLAEQLRATMADSQALVLMGSELPFPFELAAAKQHVLPGIADHCNAALQRLTAQNIASRLASLQDFPGCYHGYITALAEQWLTHLSEPQRKQVAIYACGPQPMLAAVAKLAKSYNLPCQISLEEFMACAVGGCAGCCVQVHTEKGSQMQRVCVEGPVFAAEHIFPAPPQRITP